MCSWERQAFGLGIKPFLKKVIYPILTLPQCQTWRQWTLHLGTREDGNTLGHIARSSHWLAVFIAQQDYVAHVPSPPRPPKTPP